MIDFTHEEALSALFHLRIAWQQRLDDDVGDLGPAMGRARMALNGTEAVAASIVPALLNAVARLTLGETLTPTIGSVSIFTTKFPHRDKGTREGYRQNFRRSRNRAPKASTLPDSAA